MFEDKKTQHTALKEWGEFALIKHLTQQIDIANPTTIKGIGDDAAVLKISNKHIVISTDMLLEGVHFNLAYTPLVHLGYKAVTVNLSDIYAMNAIPTQITVSVAASNRFTVEALETLYEGILRACKNYGVDLVGGDTASSNTGLVISIMAIGQADEKDIVYRNGAQVNDLIVVSGDLGGAYLGLQVLERENEVFKINPHMQPDLTGYEYILERQLKPEARKNIQALLKELNIKPSAMIDISDGLASEILHLCDQSQTGCRLYEEKIPLDPQVISTTEEFRINPVTAALNGGEDYELLFTIPLDQHELIKKYRKISVIGHMTDKKEGTRLVNKGGQMIPLTAQGWDAFLKKNHTS
ncbi:MAG: thiamine-phosphate kinase [Flavobacteriales bacterium Tduv]